MKPSPEPILWNYEPELSIPVNYRVLMLLATNKVIIYGVHYMEFTSKNPALTSVQCFYHWYFISAIILYCYNFYSSVGSWLSRHSIMQITGCSMRVFWQLLCFILGIRSDLWIYINGIHLSRLIYLNSTEIILAQCVCMRVYLHPFEQTINSLIHPLLYQLMCTYKCVHLHVLIWV